MMTPSRSYYTLVASLPLLPDFEIAERLPINRHRLRERLLMLDPDDRGVAHRATEFLSWQAQPIDRTDREIVAFFRREMMRAANPTLRALLTYRMERRTVQAALRRRHLGLPPPEGDDWGVGPAMRLIRQRWSQPDFGLGPLYPWVPRMVRLLDAGDTMGLERFLMRTVWDHHSRMAEPFGFRFETVLIYLFKWDILSRWLAQDARQATTRFASLVEEIVDAPA